MSFLHFLRQYIWKLKLDVVPFTSSTHILARKKLFFKKFKIDTLLDVGANSGQFATETRADLQYKGLILSFEPLSTAYSALVKNAETDSNWKAFNYALGDSNETQLINISRNLMSSSLLEMLPEHVLSAPESQYIDKEEVVVKTLDAIFPELCKNSKNVFMKIDTQGFEKKVLDGGIESLGNIDTIQMEMSLKQLYSHELTLDQHMSFMTSLGYELIAIDSGFSDPETGRVLQVDGIFHRYD
jgi:FkbM family methyltransferase